MSIFEKCPLPGHWDTLDGGEMARHTAGMRRESLMKGEISDLALANLVFLASRNDLDLIVYQTAAKERIRWLSARLAICEAALAQIKDLPGELNMANYGEDDVALLNQSHIEAYHIADQALSQPKCVEPAIKACH